MIQSTPKRDSPKRDSPESDPVCFGYYERNNERKDERKDQINPPQSGRYTIIDIGNQGSLAPSSVPPANQTFLHFLQFPLS